MATTAIREPDHGSMLARLDRRYFRLESFLNGISAALIFVMMFVAVAEVLMRRLFNSPIPGQADVIEIMIPTVGFFGLAYCHRLAGHVRMEILLHRLKGRTLWIAEFVGNIAIICIVAVLIWGSYLHFRRAYQIGDTTMDAEIIVWPPKLIICLGFIVLFGRLILVFFGYLRLIRNPDAAPVAVPISPSAEEFAAAEAESARAVDADEGR